MKNTPYQDSFISDNALVITGKVFTDWEISILFGFTEERKSLSTQGREKVTQLPYYLQEESRLLVDYKGDTIFIHGSRQEYGSLGRVAKRSNKILWTWSFGP